MFLFLLLVVSVSSAPPPVSQSSSNSPNLIYGPSSTPTRSQTPNAPWFTPATDPSIFCYAGTTGTLLQLFALQTNSWLPVDTFSSFVWNLQSLNYFNYADRIRGIAAYKALTLQFTSPYDITPWEPPTFPDQSRFLYSSAYITIRFSTWPGILTSIIGALSFPVAPYNVTQIWAGYFYGNLTLAVMSLAEGVGVYDQLSFELSPPTEPSLPIVWVLFDPELGCQIPTLPYTKPSTISIGVPCHKHLLTFNSIIDVARSFCKPLLPGNCESECCCVVDYACNEPNTVFGCGPVNDSCCVAESTPSSCPLGQFAVSFFSCLTFYSSDSVTPTISLTASNSPFTPTSSPSLSRTPTSTPSLSNTPTNSPISATPSSTSIRRRGYMLPGNCSNVGNGCCCLMPDMTCMAPIAGLVDRCAPDDDNCCILDGVGPFNPCPNWRVLISYDSCRTYFGSDSVSPTVSVSNSITSSSTRTPNVGTPSPTNSPSLSRTPTNSPETRSPTSTLSVTPTSSVSISSSPTPSQTPA